MATDYRLVCVCVCEIAISFASEKKTIYHLQQNDINVNNLLDLSN